MCSSTRIYTVLRLTSRWLETIQVVLVYSCTATLALSAACVSAVAGRPLATQTAASAKPLPSMLVQRVAIMARTAQNMPQLLSILP